MKFWPTGICFDMKALGKELSLFELSDEDPELEIWFSFPGNGV